MRSRSHEDVPALDLKSFHILVVLARGPLHGYAIRQEVEELTGGTVRLWPATLYGLLSELSGERLIAETSPPRGSHDDPRRRHYQLTPAGRRLLEAEASRLQRLARLARSRLAVGGTGP